MTKNKRKIFNNIKNTYCRLEPSKIAGVGVFTVRDIPKNIKIFKNVPNYKWYSFKMSDFKNLDKELLKMIDNFFVIEKDNSVHIPEYAFNGMDMSFYVNHSHKPNLKTIDNGYTFVSLRKIYKGEELTVCYADYDYKYKTKKVKK